MLKNFLQLFAILTVITLIFIFNIETIFLIFLGSNHSTDTKNSPFHVPFFLIKRDLYKEPQSKWQETIKKLETHYGYPLKLKNINNLNLNSGQKEELRLNKVLILDDNYFSEDDDIWYSTLKNSDLIILLYMSEPHKIATHRANKGIFYSFIKYMNEVPEVEWQQQFELFKQQFGVLVKRIPIKELNIQNKDLSELEKGNIIGIDTDLPTFMFYKKIPNSHYVLQLKPYGNINSDSFLAKNYQIVFPGILASLLAIALYLWMRPIWRDFNKLNTVTTKFGQGDFNLRSTLPKKSAIWNLSETFNNMASRISKLITSHKDLTNAVSHELRTPLSRLRFANAMLNEDKDDSHKQEYIDSMRIDIEELELLVSELLSYARFDRENPELIYCELNISDWLTEVIEKIDSENITTNLQIVNKVNNKSQLINIDPKLIERVLNNLIRNAIRYAKNRVDICLSIKDSNCCISVDDDGSGIPENERERILQPFTRLDFSRNRKTGGYGLGLSIVQQIVKWHNGSINISTSRYRGASFEICLPIKPSR